ncbi:TRAP transporter small permease [Metabacillus litoralis]|uniref:TRAP transporter small permease n=1 Tax=Metabacillus litoralis TaxID=152268 RepID=UPI00203BB29E|nr:TRAP transporter small permease [Metabacillus litoralis]MCM3160777.1 TRAP transporter small permease [Metabacillus litoralis]
MYKLGEVYLKLTNKINKLITLSLALLLVVMVVVIFCQVFFRFVLEDSITWSEELARFIMVWGVFLGVAYASRKGQLIAVEVLPVYLPKKAKLILHFIVQVLALVFCVIFFKYGFLMTLQVMEQTSPALGISMSVPYSSIPIGMALMFINIIATMVDVPKNVGGVK